MKQRAELFNTEVLKWCDSDCVAGKAEEECLHRDAGVGTFSVARAKPETVMYYNNTKYSVDLDQMARAYSVKGGVEDGRWPCNILDLAGINARILFKEQQQQESLEEIIIIIIISWAVNFQLFLLLFFSI